MEGSFTIFPCWGHQIMTSKLQPAQSSQKQMSSFWCALFSYEFPTHYEFCNGRIPESVLGMHLQYLSKITVEFVLFSISNNHASDKPPWLRYCHCTKLLLWNLIIAKFPESQISPFVEHFTPN